MAAWLSADVIAAARSALLMGGDAGDCVGVIAGYLSLPGQLYGRGTVGTQWTSQRERYHPAR